MCKEFSLILECSTEGPGSTVFKGDLLNCAESNHEILLLHSRFNTSNGPRRICNNGTILGYSLPFNTSSNCYISQLCIKTIQDADGEVIRCVHDTNMEKEVGNYTITADGKYNTCTQYLPLFVSYYTMLKTSTLYLHIAPSVPTQGNGKATTASTNTIHSKGTQFIIFSSHVNLVSCVYAFSHQFSERW